MEGRFAILLGKSVEALLCGEAWSVIVRPWWPASILVSMDERQINEAAGMLMEAGHLCVSTGAGMSAESGVPTFRDAQGLWKNFNPLEVATPEAFARDPARVWEWYRLRRTDLQRCRPHVGHQILARWESELERATLVTQNVDGLHHRAGSQNVLELHGRIDRAVCTGCDQSVVGLTDLGPDPRCSACDARMRPAVVWFGESLPEGQLSAAFSAAEACDVFMVIGTSGEVYPASMLFEVARGAGKPTIEINPNPTDYSRRAGVYLQAPCGVALQALDSAWRQMSR